MTNLIFGLLCSFLDVWQEIGSDAKQWQERRELEYILDAGQVGYPYEEGFLLQVVHLMKCVRRLFQNPNICQKYLHIVCKVTK